MLQVGQGLGLASNAAHLAVYFIDCLIDKSPNCEAELYIYATAALMLAAKSVEKDERIPYISKMLMITGNVFTAEQIRNGELTICDTLDWHLQNGTLVDQLEILFTFGILFSSDDLDDSIHTHSYSVTQMIPEKVVSNPNVNQLSIDHNDNENPSAEVTVQAPGSPTAQGQPHLNGNPGNKRHDYHELMMERESQATTETSVDQNTIPVSKLSKERIAELIQTLQKQAYSIGELCLVNPDYYAFPDEILSSAIVALVRRNNRLTPYWNAELEGVTGVSSESLAPCLNKLNEQFDKVYREYKTFIPYKNTHIVPPPTNFYNAVDYMIDCEIQYEVQQYQQYQAQALAAGMQPLDFYQYYQMLAQQQMAAQQGIEYQAGAVAYNGMVWANPSDGTQQQQPQQQIAMGGMMPDYMFYNGAYPAGANGTNGQPMDPNMMMYGVVPGQVMAYPVGYEQQWGVVPQNGSSEALGLFQQPQQPEVVPEGVAIVVEEKIETNIESQPVPIVAEVPEAEQKAVETNSTNMLIETSNEALPVEIEEKETKVVEEVAVETEIVANFLMPNNNVLNTQQNNNVLANNDAIKLLGEAKNSNSMPNLMAMDNYGTMELSQNLPPITDKNPEVRSK